MSVEPEELNGTEQAVLLVLMAEARPVRNPDLALLGPELKKTERDRLVRNGLIEVDVRSRPMVLELTDKGWATCAKLIGTEPPQRPSGQGKALYTLLKALRRHFDRADLAPGDVFLPEAEGTSDPDPEARVRTAYARLAAHHGEWVDLARLRGELADVPRPDLDGVLARMYRVPGVSLIPLENQKTLTEADHAAAIVIGDQHKHLIAIEG